MKTQTKKNNIVKLTTGFLTLVMLFSVYFNSESTGRNFEIGGDGVRGGRSTSTYVVVSANANGGNIGG